LVGSGEYVKGRKCERLMERRGLLGVRTDRWWKARVSEEGAPVR
jgi:hypothetical protein